MDLKKAVNDKSHAMEIKRLVEIAEKKAQDITTRILNIFRTSNSIHILYCGSSKHLAQYIVNLLKVSKSSADIAVFQGDLYTQTILPYIEKPDIVVVLSSRSGRRCLARTTTSLGLMNVKVFVLIPSDIDLDEVKKRGYPSIEFIEIESNLYRLTTINTFLRIAVAISTSERIKRLENELGITGIVEDLIDRYEEILRVLKSSREDIAIVTLPSIECIADELVDRGYTVYTYDDITSGRYMESRHSHIVIVNTSIEDHIANELTIEIMRSNPKTTISRLRMNTDPFSAPMYILILLLYALS